MPRPIEAIVHAGALAANLEVVRRAAAGARVWAVVKADAYGHGIANVYAGLRRADGFALLDPAEAERLRALGWRGPILLLEGCFDGRDLETCSRLKLWHVVHCAAQIDRLAALKTDAPHHVFLKLNSGMNRLGFALGPFRAAWQRLDALAQVETITTMTHLAHADAGDPGAIDAALLAFEGATADLPGDRSVGNSAATLRVGARLAADGASWVRPGIALYGSSPDHPLHSADDWGLAPAMTLRTRLIAVQELAAGDNVG
ncbi:MAG: alanine racemase, partial [Caldimonas sp.]